MHAYTVREKIYGISYIIQIQYLLSFAINQNKQENLNRMFRMTSMYT